MRISLEPSYKKDHFDIHVEGELFIQAPGVLINLFSIREDFDFDLSDLSCFAVAVNLYLCKTEAYRILARKAHSEAELSGKLHRAGFMSETVLTILAILSLTGHLDDRSLANDLVRYKAERSLVGPRRLRQELRLRAVSSADTEAALDAYFTDETEERLAGEAVRRKYLRLNKPLLRDKIYLFLVRRGFSSDVAAAVAGQYSQEQDREHEAQHDEQYRYPEGFF